MKIAIVHDYLTKVGGAQNVLKVLHQIFPEAPIYTLLYDEQSTKGMFSQGYDIIPSSLQHKPQFIRKKIKFLLNSFPRAIEEFDLSDYDVVISSSNSFAHGVLTRPETLHISYCYSPMRYVWDWHSEYLIENHISKGLVGAIARSMLSRIRVWDYLAGKRVDRYVAISETVKERIKKYYREPATVIYPPADLSTFKISHRNDDYYYIVSTLTPYKKIDLAVEAFNNNGKRLIIAGEGPDFQRLKRLAKSDKIELLGFVDKEKASQLMANCKAFVFPGEEDFGLTPVEAMACGKPVIAYGKGGVVESVIEEATGYFFTQASAESLNQAIDKFEKSPAIDPQRCRRQAEKFSKEVFAASFTTYVEQEYKKFKDANH